MVRVVVLVAVVTADDADSKRVYNKPRREIKNEVLEIPLEMSYPFLVQTRQNVADFYSPKRTANNCGINNNIIKQQH